MIKQYQVPMEENDVKTLMAHYGEKKSHHAIQRALQDRITEVSK